MAKNYHLPKVEQLDDLDFQFEFNTMKEATNYIRNFVKNNKQSLIDLFFPGMDPDVYKERKKNINCKNNEEVTQIINAKMRISRGRIKREDWLYKVPTFMKYEKKILLEVHQNLLERYMIDSQLAFYDQTYMGIKRKKGMKLVLHNELLRLIILYLPENPLGDVEEVENTEALDKLYKRYKNLIIKNHELKNRNSLFPGIYRYNILKIQDQIHETIFSSKRDVRQKADRTLHLIGNNPLESINPKYTSIKDKENVIRQYLKTQTQQIRSSSNSRSKGINAKKKQSVLSFKSQNPKASISEIAQKCSVDRKTVRKYLNE